MTALALVTLTVGIGFFTSWLPQLRRLRLWRLLLLGLAGVFLMLPLAALLRSNTLGWMAGLSFIFVLPVLLLLGIGVVLGHWPAVKDPKKDIEKDAAAIAPVAAPRTLQAGIDAVRQRFDGLLIVAGIGAGFVVAIGTGFRISGDPVPAAVSIAYVPGLVVLAGTIRMVLWRIAQNWRCRLSEPTSTRDARRRMAEHRLADRVAYELDRDATATCEHLHCLSVSHLYSASKCGRQHHAHMAGVGERHKLGKAPECAIDPPT